jgi:hypothetical protein
MKAKTLLTVLTIYGSMTGAHAQEQAQANIQTTKTCVRLGVSAEVAAALVLSTDQDIAFCQSKRTGKAWLEIGNASGHSASAFIGGMAGLYLSKEVTPDDTSITSTDKYAVGRYGMGIYEATGSLDTELIMRSGDTGHSGRFGFQWGLGLGWQPYDDKSMGTTAWNGYVQMTRQNLRIIPLTKVVNLLKHDGSKPFSTTDTVYP